MPFLSSTGNHRVMLVEDRAADVRLTKRALSKAGYALDIAVAENGQDAIDQLTAGYKPDLILLDWMMPLMNGGEVLAALRQSEEWRSIPVIVLTTSDDEKDVSVAYSNGCNAYLTKPVDPSDFQETIDAMGLFWLKKAVLPSR